MMMKTGLLALMGLVALTEASTIHRPDLVVRQNRFGQGNGNANRGGNANAGGNNAATNTGGNTANAGGNNNAASNTCLSSNALQTGSASTGQVNGVAADGQVNSATDTANFINFCSGKTLTNGAQNTAGSCNGIPMGEIPAKAKMVSTVILNPKNGDNLAANTDFDIQLSIANMELGSFTNATSTYYSAPQQLSSGGDIIGHTHVTVQDTGNSLNPTTPLDATQFVFFKGINDAGNGQGVLNTTVTGGLPAGNYRLCSMAGSSNHQPVLMPVAQRGAQDDCKYFTVGGSGSAASGGSAASSGSAASGGNAGQGASTSSGGNAGKASATGGSQGNGAGASSTAANGNKVSKATTTVATAAGATAAAGGSSAGGAIAGVAAPAVQSSGDSARPFSVDGSTFVNKSAAVQRACSIQNNGCADAVNSGKAPGKTVADCNAQEQQCLAASN